MPLEQATNQFTRILQLAGNGDTAAATELFPLVYEELRRVAAAQLGRESPGQTLQPTALVHEAWLRLSAGDDRTWKNRGHFVAAATEAMRRILVDRARRKLRLKRGAGAERVELEESRLASPVEDEKILEVNSAVDRLEAESAELAQIVKLRFFAGMNHLEVAEVLGVNEKTVRRRWELARVRLHALIMSAPE